MTDTDIDVTKRKDELFETTAKDKIFTTCLVRRRKSKSGNHRYYIYDSSDNLQVAAECEVTKDYNFIVSLDATEFNKNGPYTIANLVHHRYHNYYDSEILKNGSFQKYMTISFLSHYEKKNKKRKIKISFEPNLGPQGIITQSDDFDSSYKLVFPDLSDKIDKSSKNFFLATSEGKLCFSLAKMFKDEFHLAISYPLSILDGFLIALTTFHVLKNE